MGFGCYATVGDIQGILGLASTTDVTVIRKIVEAASRSIDSYCNRIFFTQSATKYFDGAKTLWVPDLLTVTTLRTDEDGDGTYENTFQVATEPIDYLLYGTGLEDSYNTYPKTRIEIAENSDYGSFASGVKRGVQIVGLWGYGDGISATPYVIDTTTNDELTAGETDVTVSAVINLSAGQVLLLVDSDTDKTNEQIYIYSIDTTNKILTVERGVNGTSDQAHATPKTLYIYQYPSDIRQACIDLSVALYQNRAKQGLQTERLGDYSYTVAGTSLGKSMVESILENIHSYKRLRF